MNYPAKQNSPAYIAMAGFLILFVIVILISIKGPEPVKQISLKDSIATDLTLDFMALNNLILTIEYPGSTWVFIPHSDTVVMEMGEEGIISYHVIIAGGR